MNMQLSTLRLDIHENPADHHLAVELLIDEKPFGNAVVDLTELRQSALASGGYYILTCGCGVPGCAGFFAPIGVAHIGDRVTWECDDRYYPKPEPEVQRDAQFLVYEFDRQQYIDAIRQVLVTLRDHPLREDADIGPYGFDKKVLDLPLPEATPPTPPFKPGATLVVGYIGEYKQPWVWIDGERDIPARHLLPTMTLWHKFGYWASMWDAPIDMGICTWKKDGQRFQPEPGVTSEICNQAVEDLARELKLFWGEDVEVEVEDVEIDHS